MLVQGLIGISSYTCFINWDWYLCLEDQRSICLMDIIRHSRTLILFIFLPWIKLGYIGSYCVAESDLPRRNLGWLFLRCYEYWVMGNHKCNEHYMVFWSTRISLVSLLMKILYLVSLNQEQSHLYYLEQLRTTRFLLELLDLF